MRILQTLLHALQGLLFFAWEWVYTLWSCPAFLPILWRLWEWSFFHSPYRLTYRSKDAARYDLTYGELALPSVLRVLDLLDLQPEDKLVDLGSGRGRVVLLAASRGIAAQGIELVPGLIETARYAAGPHLPLATFTQADFLTVDLQGCSVVWAVGTCWDSITRQQVTQKLLQLPKGTRVVSITRPFAHKNLPILHTIEGWTSWGRDRYYIQTVSTSP